MSRHQIHQIALTEEELKELRKRIRQAKDRKTADRLRVIWLKAGGYKHHVIAHLLQMSINNITNGLKRYLAGGLDAACATKYQGKQARLTVKQQEILKIEFDSLMLLDQLQSLFDKGVSAPGVVGRMVWHPSGVDQPLAEVCAGRRVAETER